MPRSVARCSRTSASDRRQAGKVLGLTKRCSFGGPPCRLARRCDSRLIYEYRTAFEGWSQLLTSFGLVQTTTQRRDHQ